MNKRKRITWISRVDGSTSMMRKMNAGLCVPGDQTMYFWSGPQTTAASYL